MCVPLRLPAGADLASLSVDVPCAPLLAWAGKPKKKKEKGLVPLANDVTLRRFCACSLGALGTAAAGAAGQLLLHQAGHEQACL